MVNVGIIGATGYTGEEAIKILLHHPHAKISALTALPEECGKIGDIFPSLRKLVGIDVKPLELDAFATQVDVALCCLPHKVSMSMVPKLLDAGLKVIDFSADYRLKDIPTYEKYYVKHTDPENLAKAAFGLPELFRSQIKGKSLIANPGCYPTCASLGLAPLLAEGLIENDNIIVNSVTGVSGAGRKASLTYHLPEMNENIFAYAAGGIHRHNPEINQICSQVAGKPTEVLFQPHVAAFDRGILSSIYARPAKTLTRAMLGELYTEYYKSEIFVRVLNVPPAVKAVARTNFCDIFPTISADGKTVIVFSAIDNLIKGASGQAIQNMNIICGFDESEGLL
jgi:N-acetyl-gamma-glutamyl-phosphate reductase